MPDIPIVMFDGTVLKTPSLSGPGQRRKQDQKHIGNSDRVTKTLFHEGYSKGVDRADDGGHRKAKPLHSYFEKSNFSSTFEELSFSETRQHTGRTCLYTVICLSLHQIICFRVC